MPGGRIAPGALGRRRFLQAAAVCSLVSTAGVGRTRRTATQPPDDEREVWSTRMNPTRSSPTVVDGAVFTADVAGTIYALDATSGDEEWRFETGSEESDAYEIHASPTVAGGWLYAKGADADVYALDAASGEVEWRFGPVYPIFGSPTVVDGTVYLGSEDGVWAVNASGSGSSEDSRVLLGTLGHHGDWRYTDQSLTDEPVTDTPGSAGAETGTGAAAESEDGEPATETRSTDEAADGSSEAGENEYATPTASPDDAEGDLATVELPGFGIASAVASLAGAGYLLARRSRDDEP